MGRKLSHHAYYVEGSLREYDALDMPARPLHRTAHERFGIDEARHLIDLSSLRNVQDTLFLIEAASITTEAQQALLKLFEEPQAGTTFILIVPHGALLPTLRSRMLEYPGLRRTTHAPSGARAFLQSSRQERSTCVEKLLKQDDKESVRAFVNALEAELYARLRKSNTPAAREALGDVALVRQYLGDRSPSVKMLLEHLVIALPVI